MRVSKCFFVLFGTVLTACAIPEEASNSTTEAPGKPTTVATAASSGNDKWNGIDDWEPPEWILKHYPYYLTGYDYDGRPTWIAELGRYNMRKLVESGDENQKLFTKYIVKTARLIHNYTDTSPLNELNFILDFEGLSIEQFASIPTVTYTLGLGLQHRNLLEAGRVNKIYLINANYVTDSFVRLAKSIFGRLFEVVEVYGANKGTWMPKLLRLMPRDQLPEWYGGIKEHTPVLIYG